VRSVDDWNDCGPMLRLHVGLESPADLIADLHAGFVAAGLSA
jgi:cystathionine beta-lyase